MNTPESLHIGDKIAIISVGKRITQQEIKKAIDTYISWGLQVTVGRTISDQDNSSLHRQSEENNSPLGHSEGSYLGVSDEIKIQELQAFIDDSEIKAIIFARGGYGAVRIIDEINFTPLTAAPKWLVGFSDVTVLHNQLNTLQQLITLHGIMPVFFNEATASSVESCKKILFSGKMNYQHIGSPSPLNKSGKCQAKIVGGNLSIIYSLCGSKSQLDTKGKILFIEDLHEPLYHVDRMLQNLSRNGLFDDLKGIIIGSFTHIEIGNPPFAENTQKVFMHYFAPLNIPIYNGFPSGHINDNHALIFGQTVEMEVKSNNISIKTVN